MEYTGFFEKITMNEVVIESITKILKTKLMLISLLKF